MKKKSDIIDELMVCVLAFIVFGILPAAAVMAWAWMGR